MVDITVENEKLTDRIQAAVGLKQKSGRYQAPLTKVADNAIALFVLGAFLSAVVMWFVYQDYIAYDWTGFGMVLVIGVSTAMLYYVFYVIVDKIVDHHYWVGGLLIALAMYVVNSVIIVSVYLIVYAIPVDIVGWLLYLVANMGLNLWNVIVVMVVILLVESQAHSFRKSVRGSRNGSRNGSPA